MDSPNNGGGYPPSFTEALGGFGGGGDHYHSSSSYLRDENPYDRRGLLLDDDNDDDDEERGGVGGGLRSRTTTTTFDLMKRIGHLLAIVTTMTAIIAVPIATIRAVRERNVRTDSVAFYSAGLFAFLAVVLSTREIYRHLTNWYVPDVQKYVVRILWMVPLYAIQSWLSLRFRSARIYIDAVRDLYEAYVIQSFVYYLIELLGGEETLTIVLRSKDDRYGKHSEFVKCFVRLRDWEMGTEFLLQCKRGALQYVVLKIVATTFTVVLERAGRYGEGQFDLRCGYPYLAFVMNISVMYALYCLLLLYHATADELRSPKNWRPVGKFLCVKGVIFFTFWQSVVIFFLRSKGIIGDVGTWDADEVGNAVQDYLVCVEMFFFAIAHSYTFTYEEYLPSGVKATKAAKTTKAGGRGFFGGGKAGNYARGVRGGGGGNGFGKEGGNATNGGAFSFSMKEITTAIYGADDAIGHGCDENVTDDDADDDEYRPPVVRTLDAPMSLRDALWSSAVPDETVSDIKRLRNGVEGGDEADESGIMISMGSMRHAESI